MLALQNGLSSNPSFSTPDEIEKNWCYLFLKYLEEFPKNQLGLEFFLILRFFKEFAPPPSIVQSLVEAARTPQT